MKNIVVFLLLFATALTAQTTTVTYAGSTADFPNPERGFYRYSATNASPYSYLDVDELREWRSQHTPPSAQYQVYSTLVFRYFFLDDFVESPISKGFLDNVAQDFATAREAGVKIIARFAYTEEVNGTGCGSWICPPYGDASKAQALAHIAQLKPVLQANGDVVAVVQLGFIGVWGEGYYTDFFGDASQPPYLLTAQNWQDRNELLTALLDAVPQERMVQVRYPHIKQRLIYGIDAPTSAAALTPAEAHDGSPKSRIGHHNDCFLASETDFGTYDDYGPATPGSDTAALKPYKAADSRFTAVGGETCASYNPHDNCQSAGGMADVELRRFHYSYLNSQYNNPDVNNNWVAQGCIEDIKRNLGYRFTLLDGDYSQQARPGDAVSIKVNLKNEGYAPPFNPHAVELILRDTAQGLAFWAKLPEADPRFWEAGTTHTVEVAPCLPSNIPMGNYELLLHLPDPSPSIHHRPEYAIRLANTGVWEAATGFNHLLHSIEVTPLATPATCNSAVVFEAAGPINGTGSVAPERQGWKVYPNPASTVLFVENEGLGSTFGHARLFNALGQPVQAVELQGGEPGSFDLENLPVGAYWLQLQSGMNMRMERVLVWR